MSTSFIQEALISHLHQALFQALGMGQWAPEIQGVNYLR